MTEQEKFLWLVQTAVLANGINLSNLSSARDPVTREKDRAEYSATGVLGLMADALYASERIPQGMSAADAAGEFCEWMFDAIREQRQKAGENPQVPDWFARG